MRTLLRFIGMVLLAAAVVAATIDGTRSIAESAMLITPLEQTLTEVSAPSLEAAQAFIVRNAGETTWTSAVVPVLRLPAAAVFAVLALIFLLLGRGRRDALS